MRGLDCLLGEFIKLGSDCTYCKFLMAWYRGRKTLMHSDGFTGLGYLGSGVG